MRVLLFVLAGMSLEAQSELESLEKLALRLRQFDGAALMQAKDGRLDEDLRRPLESFQRELRGWVGKQLDTVKDAETGRSLIEAALRKAAILRPRRERGSVSEPYGALLEIRIQMLGDRWAFVLMSFDSLCSPDDRMEIYEKQEGKWRPFASIPDQTLESTKGTRDISGYLAAPVGRAPERFVLGIATARSICPGSDERLGPNALDIYTERGRQVSWSRTGPAAARAKVEAIEDGVHFEINAAGWMANSMTQVPLHYAWRRDEVRRLDPIARNPGDFLQEWASLPWEEASEWIVGLPNGAQRRLHEELAGNIQAVFSDRAFVEICEREPLLLALGFLEWSEAEERLLPMEKRVLIRAGRGHAYRLVDVVEEKPESCSEERHEIRPGEEFAAPRP